jgi:hypothetical protein
MSLKRIIASGIIGTTAMSGFSYALAARTRKQFREPELLQKVLKRTGIQKRKILKAWTIHYVIGILFTSLYHLLWKNKKSNPQIIEGSLLGGISGIIGILVWRSVLNSLMILRPVYRKSYYMQLFLAHIIFGSTAAFFYRKDNFKSINK